MCPETEEKEADRSRIGKKNLLTFMLMMEMWSSTGSKISWVPKIWVRKRVDLWVRTKLTSLRMECTWVFLRSMEESGKSLETGQL